jgi:hypothetical protein
LETVNSNNDIVKEEYLFFDLGVIVKLRISVGVVTALIFSSGPAVHGQPAPETNFAVSVWKQVPTTSLGTLSYPVAVSNAAGQKRYYLLPFLQYDSSNLREQHSASCLSAASKVPQEFSFDATFNSARLRGEIESVLRSEGQGPKDSRGAFLQPYPYQFIEIYVAPGFDTVGFYPQEAPLAFERGQQFTARAGFDDTAHKITFSAACKEVADILSGDTRLSARMVSAIRRSTQNVTAMSYQSLLRSNALNQLFNDTKKSGAVVVNSDTRGGGTGVNFLGLIQSNSASTSGTTTTQDKRQILVSENYLNEIIQDASSQMEWGAFFDGPLPEDMDARRASAVNTLTNLLAARFREDSIAISSLADGGIALAGGRISTILSKEAINEILKSDRALSGTTSTSDSVGGGQGGDLSTSASNSFTGSSGISWTRSGGSYIPTSARLYSFSRSDLRKSFSIALQSTALSPEVTQQYVALTVVDTRPSSEPWKRVVEYPQPMLSSTSIHRKTDGKLVETYYCNHPNLQGFSIVPAPTINQNYVRSETVNGYNGLVDSADATRCLPASRTLSPSEYAISQETNVTLPRYIYPGSVSPWVGHGAGCLVNNDWLDWYLRELAVVGGLPSRVVCHDGTSESYRAAPLNRLPRPGLYDGLVANQ